MKSKNDTIQVPLSLVKIADYFFRRGYYISDEDKNKISLFRDGTSLTTSLKRMPLHLNFETTSSSTKITLGYGCWVFFDTGDLAKELSRIVESINDNIDTLTGIK